MTAWSEPGGLLGPHDPDRPHGHGDPDGAAALPVVPSLHARLLRAEAENRQWRMLAGLLLGGVLLGLAQAGLWARIAPGEVFKIFTDGGYGSLPTASGFRYTAIAMFCVIGLVVGIIQAVGAWAWRSVRGSITLLGVGLGAGVGALTAYLIGRAVAGGVLPGSVGAAPTERIVHAPPVSGSAIVLLAQPAAALLVYTLLAAWSGRADLGRPVLGGVRADSGGRGAADHEVESSRSGHAWPRGPLVPEHPRSGGPVDPVEAGP